MALNITTNFTGTASDMIISKGFYQAKSIQEKWVTEHLGIKDKLNVQTLNLVGAIQDYACDWNEQGDINYVDLVLQPVAKMINVSWCETDFETTWQSAKMREGANNPEIQELEGYIASLVEKSVLQGVEQAMWGFPGAEITGVSFYDALDAASGVVTVDGAVLTEANVLAEIKKVWLAIPDVVLANPATAIYVNYTIARLYASALATSSGDANYSVTTEKPLMYQGVPIRVMPGAANKMIATYPGNLHIGSDLISDYSQIKPFRKDENDRVYLKSRFKIGTQISNPFEIVYYRIP